MKIKKNEKKLSLNKVIVTNLSPTEMNRSRGGTEEPCGIPTWSPTCPPNETCYAPKCKPDPNTDFPPV